MSNDEKKKEIEREETRLDSGFHYFLVGTAFLVAAFGVVATRSNGLVDTSELRLVAFAINALGLYIALLFTANNYYSAWEIKFRETQIEGTGNRFNKRLAGPGELLKELGRDLWRLFKNPLNIDRNRFVLAWLIPSFFIVFWIFTWFILLSWSWWKIPGIVIFLPVAYLVVQCFCCRIELFRMGRRTRKRRLDNAKVWIKKIVN